MKTITKVYNEIKLPGGWLLVRDDNEFSSHYFNWFLSTPYNKDLESHIWVAKFWDSSERDVIDFALSLGVKLEDIGEIGESDED